MIVTPPREVVEAGARLTTATDSVSPSRLEAIAQMLQQLIGSNGVVDWLKVAHEQLELAQRQSRQQERIGSLAGQLATAAGQLRAERTGDSLRELAKQIEKLRESSTQTRENLNALICVIKLDMKRKRFLYAEGLTECHNSKALLVLSRKGGFVSRNCLRCGKSERVRWSQLPTLRCERKDCNGESVAPIPKGDKNYWYRCGKCGDEWELASAVPEWSDLFPYSGLAAPGDPSWP